MAAPTTARELLLPQIRTAAISVLVLLVFGTLGFRATGGDHWSLFDAAYMTLMTITTVGFEEVHPLGTGGRLVAIALMLSGVGVLIYVTGSIAEAIIEGRVFWRQRVSSSIRRLSGHIVVCGYGRVGRAICRTLAAQHVEHVAISLEDPGESSDLVVIGDATDDDVLRSAGIERARGLVTVLGSDAANIYCILASRALRPDLFVMSRCGEERSAAKMRAAGAQRVINPYEHGGQLMAQVVLRPHVMDFMDSVLGQEFEVLFEEVRLGPASTLAGQTLRDSPLRREVDVIVTAIIKHDGRKVFNPAPTEQLAAGDTLIVMGRPDALDRLRAMA